MRKSSIFRLLFFSALLFSAVVAEHPDAQAQNTPPPCTTTYDCASVTSPTLRSDCEELKSIYNATCKDGGGWMNIDNPWFANNDVGSWEGVTVKNDRVTKLALVNKNLTREIPTALGNLTELTDLYLNNNQLTGGIPAALGNLVKLKKLRLNGNQLRGGAPTALGNLAELFEGGVA